MAKDIKEKKETASVESKENEVDKQEDTLLEKTQKELAEAKEILLRTAAEFDNYKKRTERDRIASLE